MSGITSESAAPGRLLPRFTLGRFLIGFTLCIFFAWFIRQAFSGQLWAIALVFTVCSTAAFFLIYAVVFLKIWLPAKLWRGSELDVQEGSPFARDQLPPQVVQPRNDNVVN